MNLYDYAISFAAPQRDLARQLNELLRAAGCRVYFDEDFEYEMLGRDGVDYLTNVFFREARHCVALLSEHYDQRVWSQLERRAVQARELSEPGYLIPVIVEHPPPSWLLPTKIYFDLAERDIESLVRNLARRLGTTAVFPRRHEIRVAVPSMRLASRVGGDGYVVWSGDIHRPSVVSIRRIAGEWRSELLPWIHGAGPTMAIGESSAVVVPWSNGSPIQVFHEDGGIPLSLPMPPGTANCFPITDGHSVYVSMSARDDGGGLWRIDVDSRESRRIVADPYAGHVGLSITDYGIAVVNGNTVTVHDANDGSAVASVILPTSWEARCVQYVSQERCLVVGGTGELFVLDDSLNLVLRANLPDRRQTVFMDATPDGLIAVVAGLAGFGPNVLAFYDSQTGRQLDAMESLGGSSTTWSEIALQSDRSSMAAAMKDHVVILETEIAT